ncbi:hypothetical protein Q2T76_07355 [Lactobacillus sp. YT155]|uniref:hypothetical protein n=1 Tax=Lactobacillus sp. YT155 TaxID=3060955 RepID=UPI00265EDF3D|nr:hypothetical protein [Lactobacillus sp. YT155]MDO1605876.1 hypothetical protein [Lactobacillus sp. YT155]
MKNSGKFEGTSYVFDYCDKNNRNNELDKYIDDNTLYNQSNLLFLEEEYIDGTHQFSKVTDKFKKKKFDKNLKLYSESEKKIKSVPEAYTKDSEIYKDVVSENNIERLSNSDLNISVKHFNIYTLNKEKVNFIQEIYILIFLANITKYDNNGHFEFIVKNDKASVSKKIDFNKIEKGQLFEIYDWVAESKENVQTRLNIIRQLILEKGTFEIDEKVSLQSAKSAFNRIIGEETERYFIQVNILKDDFLKLNEQVSKNNQSLHLKFLSWLSAVGIFIYDQLKNDVDVNPLYKIFIEVNDRTRIFVMLFIIALVVIGLIFWIEVLNLRKEFKKIQDLYIKNHFFEEKDFDNYIEQPKINRTYCFIFFLLLIILIFRIFL